MRKVLLSMLALCSMGVASAQMSTGEGVQARVYAYDLQQETTTKVVNEGTIASYVVTFKTNTAATSAVVNLKDANGEVVGNGVEATSNDGKNWTAEVDVTTLGANIVAGEFNWEVTVSAPAVEEIGTFYTKGFNRPSTLAIDKNPNSDLFGNIYLSENAGADKHGTSAGLYSANASLDGMTLHTISIIGTESVRSSKPRSMAVANDGQIYVSACDSGTKGVYKIDPTNGYAYTQIYNEAAAYGIGAKDDEIYYVTKSSSSSYYDINRMTTAGASNEKLFTSKITDNNVTNTSTYTGYNAIVPMEHGLWVNYSDNKDGKAIDGNQLHFVDYQGNVKWSVGDNKVLNDRSGLAVDERNGIVVYYDKTNKNFSSYSFSFDENGKISVSKEQAINVSDAKPNRVEACAFDYAGNLYIISSAGEWFKAIALPTDDNTCTTPAKETIEITADDITTGVDNIAIDANAPVEYYNLQGVKVEYPTKGIFIKKQGAKATKVVL